MWTVEFDDRARKELRKLNPDTQDRILKWLCKRIDDQPDPRRFGKALKGRMAGLWRYRVGSWRISVSFGIPLSWRRWFVSDIAVIFMNRGPKGE